MQRALSDVSYVINASEDVRQLIVPAYVEGFHQVNCECPSSRSIQSVMTNAEAVQSIVCAALWLLIAVFINQRRLK